MRIDTKTTLAALLAATVSTAALAQSDTGAANANANAGLEADVDAATGTDTLAQGDTGVSTDMETGADVSTGMDTDVADAGADTSTDMEADGDFTNYGSVIASLRAGADTTTDMGDPFAGVTEDTQVNTVLLSGLQGEGAENGAALDQALTDSGDQIASVQGLIGNNGTLNTALETEGYTPDQVVAWNTGTEGEVTFVIDDRM